jgi:hypothetical protein
MTVNKNGRGRPHVAQPEGTASAELALCTADLRQLEELEKKLQSVRDLTAMVADGRSTGLYVWGAGGCGKSHTVVEELSRLRVPYRLYNSRMTGRGLYNALEAAPGEIHLLEDMENLVRDAGAKGVLRSALGGQPSPDGKPSERVVTWTTNLMDHRFVFTGGIIMTCNRPFPPAPELDAVKTRIGYMHLSVSDVELVALMRRTALAGHRQGVHVMEAGECWEIAEYISEQCRGLRRPPDMRMLFIGYQIYLQWSECRTGCCWQDLLATHIRERPIALGDTKTPDQRASQKQQELQIAAEIQEATDDRGERFRLWQARTGKSEQTLYRRLAEL